MGFHLTGSILHIFPFICSRVHMCPGFGVSKDFQLISGPNKVEHCSKVMLYVH